MAARTTVGLVGQRRFHALAAVFAAIGVAIFYVAVADWTAASLVDLGVHSMFSHAGGGCWASDHCRGCGGGRR